MKGLIIDRREVSLKVANLRHRHIYLTTARDFFPPEAVGGSDKTQIADQPLTVTFVPDMTV